MGLASLNFTAFSTMKVPQKTISPKRIRGSSILPARTICFIYSPAKGNRALFLGSLRIAWKRG